MEFCPVCTVQFETQDKLHIHIRNKRKNKPHADYINLHVRKSFFEDDPHLYLLIHKISVSKSSLNGKWKLWFTEEERKQHGIKILSMKNSKKIWTDEQRKNVSEGLKLAYKTGKKVSALKGKVAHNKNVPCSEEQKRKISETLRRKYASGEILITNNPNNFKYGFRDDVGHFCRSSWEANICRWLKQLKIDYKYEKQSFVLSSDMGPITYKPDIYIPDKKLFLEVKGRYDEYSMLKHKLFKKQYTNFRLVVLERRKYFIIERRLCRKIINWELSAKNKDLEKYLIKG